MFAAAARPPSATMWRMSDRLYFDGDPATDSARRHMERVLKSPESARRWPWLLWRTGRDAARAKSASAKETSGAGPE